MNPHARVREHKNYARPMESRVKHCTSPEDVPTRERIARPVGSKPRRKDWQ